ncbi:hypothetical protein ACQ86I_17860 [Prescottella equi]
MLDVNGSLVTDLGAALNAAFAGVGSLDLDGLLSVDGGLSAALESAFGIGGALGGELGAALGALLGAAVEAGAELGGGSVPASTRHSTAPWRWAAAWVERWAVTSPPSWVRR